MSDLLENSDEHQYSNESFEDALSEGEELVNKTKEVIRVKYNKNDTEVQILKKQFNCLTYLSSSNKNESVVLTTPEMKHLSENLDCDANIEVEYSKNFMDSNQQDYIKFKNRENNWLLNDRGDKVRYFNKNKELNNSRIRYYNSKKENKSQYCNKSKIINFHLNKKIERNYSAITDNRRQKFNNNFINDVQAQNNETPIYQKNKNEELPKVSCNAKTGIVDKSVELVELENAFLMCLSVKESGKGKREELPFVQEANCQKNIMIVNVRYFIKSPFSKGTNLPGPRSTKLCEETRSMQSAYDSLNNKEELDLEQYSNKKSTYTPTSFNTEDYTLHVDLLRAPSASSDRLRSKHVGRKSFSFSNEQVRDIERQNNILLKKMMNVKSSVTSNIKKFSPLPANNRNTSSAINRKNQQRQIDMDNILLRRKLEAIGSRRRVFE